MNRYFSVFCAILFFTTSSVGQGIEFFHGTWKEAMAKAKSEDKLMFVDSYAKWCGPCKAMAKNVFTQQKVGDFFNANFINVKLDMEEADGVTFGHKYPVTAYPTLFFLDGEGKVIKNIKGGQQPDALIALATDAIKKNDKSGKFEEKYNAGDRSYDLVFDYVKALNAAGKPSLKISNDYLNSNPAITEEQRLKFVIEAAIDADSKLFDQVVANKATLINLLGKQAFEEKCKSACKFSIDKAVEYEMENLLTETISKAEKTFPDDAGVFSAKAGMQYYGAFKNESKYMASYKSLAKKGSKDAGILTFIVQDIMKHFRDDKKIVSDGVEYAEKAFDIKDDIESLNLYCSILIQNNEVDKAIKTVTKSKEQAVKKGLDASMYDGLLNYLQSKKS